ncbi:hypothetical protein PIB30_001752 [Stylosanthes scabra]|uniref:Pentatricopeptide repeat-containing protein n=1 Tax=Stylosanthes scabra TaxID=79078 RepID=A0ABU6V1W4_9FABA|nr:hypothetical protein [Stylosanthes scabra]
MLMTRYTFFHSTFLLRFSPSLPFCFFSHSPFPVAINNNNRNNVDDAVASFVTLLNKHHLPSVVEFNKILGSLVKLKQYPTSVSLFRQMDFRAITPDLVTLNILINCFCHLGLMDSAFSALAKIIKLGHDLNVITLNTLMKGFCINNKVKEALEFHDKVKSMGFQFDEVTYGILINGICKIGRTRAAIEFLQKLEKHPVKPDVITYNTVIDGLCKDGLVIEAKNLFSKMIARGISPDVVSIVPLFMVFVVRIN